MDSKREITIFEEIDIISTRSSLEFEPNSSSHHQPDLSITLSPSPSQSHHTTTERLETKTHPSPKTDNRCSTTAKSNREITDSMSATKSTNSTSPSNRYSRKRSSDTTNDKTRKNDETIVKSSESEKPSSSVKRDKSKSTKATSSRHRSRSHERKIDRKTIEPSSSHDSSLNKTKTNQEKDSISNHATINPDKKSSRGSSIPSTHSDHRERRRRRSSDRYQHDSSARYDRRSDHNHRHRSPYHSNTHYVHYHHHHHYRSPSPRYRRHHYQRRRSNSRQRRRSSSRHRRTRYFSSTSSSISFSPRRRTRSRTSSSSSSSSSSYTSISRSSSSTSRSSSRTNHYYHEKKNRRSPTLEKLFLKASESIEAVSTQKNPALPSSSAPTTHYLPIPPNSTTLDMPIASLPEPNVFYPERFTGFSAPPPPLNLPLQQRCLKEITTDVAAIPRTVFNEIQPVSSSTLDDVGSGKISQSNDSSTIVRPPSSRPPRVSRFSDVTSTTSSEPVINTNIPVDTPLNYTQISENINCLPASRRQQKRHNREVMECECTTSEYDRSRGIKACGSDCLNRMLLIECGPLCPCGQWCSNRRFQRHSYAAHKLALFKTEMKGHGLRTTSTIRKGRFLAEYVGEVIDMDELARRNKKYKRDGNIHQYVMSLIHGTVIDSTMKGNWARFINHSCEPNCVAEKWLVNGEYRMGIFAKRDLDVNEEITIDYRFESSNAADLANEKCYCGAPTCRGTISIKPNNNNSTKRQNRRQPLDDDELLDYLLDEHTNEYVVPKTIEEIRQLIQIMSRTDGENVRTIELNLIKSSSQKHLELPRLFLECNGLHVLCSWMKDILLENADEDEQQHYSDEFKYQLLDFIHLVLPIKDRTTVIKNGLFDLVAKKLQLPSKPNDQMNSMTDEEQIHSLMNSMLDHLENPIVAKLCHIYSTWTSLKERFIIPKRKEPEADSDHHHHRHHHHHHYSSKHRHEEPSSRLSFTTRSSYSQQKPYDRSYSRRSYTVRETPRTQEQQLSKDERRKLFEQQYEDEEKARMAAVNGESPGSQNEPPHKKQRTSDNTESMIPHTPPQPELSSAYPNQMDQTSWIHQHLSQIPIEYIRSYMASIGAQENSASATSVDKDEPVPPPPARPENEAELSHIIQLPSGWSVAMCPTDSSVYFYNRETNTTSWTPPSVATSANTSAPLLDLSPLSSAHILEQRRPLPIPHHHQHSSSSSHSNMKLVKHPHRHARTHKHHHISSTNSNKRKRPVTTTTTTRTDTAAATKPDVEGPSENMLHKTIKQEETNDVNKSLEHDEETSVSVSKIPTEDTNAINGSTTIKDDINESNNNNASSSSKINRDLLRKNISQHVHATLKPYTKRTCKQGRIASTDDIKYLVKKFTLAVLDKEIEKAKDERIPLLPVLNDRVRLKTEVYIKKYMNKMGSVFQRHDVSVSHSHSSVIVDTAAPPAGCQPETSLQATTSNSE
ncbi:unnamed protein product [Adineta ricciae]|uniref:[histone H3]-lysine(36) N-trimethyltransferase n=1 Tax=Adineta ricciae TaxID=249248 RepID=A0A813WKJ7_ADIRI|nr:unnamed protein product [Adineta ricciae]CAF0960033.1 unnamed protein product [Adineta ricciae]